MWIAIQEFLSFVIMSWGIFIVFSGVGFWESLIRYNLPRSTKNIIARLIGIIMAALGGIWMFSFRSEFISHFQIPVLLLISFFLLLLQSILVIIFGERGMTTQIKEWIGSFRGAFYVDEDTHRELPARIWGLFVFIISIIVIGCIISSIPL